MEHKKDRIGRLSGVIKINIFYKFMKTLDSGIFSGLDGGSTVSATLDLCRGTYSFNPPPSLQFEKPTTGTCSFNPPPLL
jgi:hypothetical protein